MNLYFLVIFGLIGLFTYQLFKKRKIDRKEHEDLYDIFDRHPIKQPELEIQKIKWFPTFTVTFADKSDYDYARNNGLLEKFNDRIQNTFYNNGFSAELVVNYKWNE